MSVPIRLNYPAAIPVGHVIEVTEFLHTRPEKKRRSYTRGEPFHIPVILDLDTGIRYMAWRTSTPPLWSIPSKMPPRAREPGLTHNGDGQGDWQSEPRLVAARWPVGGAAELVVHEKHSGWRACPSDTSYGRSSLNEKQGSPP